MSLNKSICHEINGYNTITVFREMRSCGIWGPMPKMDGTSLPPALLARFPKSPEGMKYLDCKSTSVAFAIEEVGC